MRRRMGRRPRKLTLTLIIDGEFGSSNGSSAPVNFNSLFILNEGARASGRVQFFSALPTVV